MIRRIVTLLAALLLFAAGASAQYSRMGYICGLSYSPDAPRQNVHGFELMESSYIFHPSPFFLDFGLEGEYRHFRDSHDDALRLGIPVKAVLDVVDFTKYSCLTVHAGVTGSYCYTRPYSYEAGFHDQEGRFLVSGSYGATLYLFVLYVTGEYTRDLMPCRSDGTKYHGFRLTVGMTLHH